VVFVTNTATLAAEMLPRNPAGPLRLPNSLLRAGLVRALPRFRISMSDLLIQRSVAGESLRLAPRGTTFSATKLFPPEPNHSLPRMASPRPAPPNAIASIRDP